MYQICRPYFDLSHLFMKREHLLTVLARVFTIVTLITPIIPLPSRPMWLEEREEQAKEGSPRKQHIPFFKRLDK